MNARCYKIVEGTVEEGTLSTFGRDMQYDIIYLCDIQVERRIEASEILQPVMLPGKIYKFLQEPSDHIIFEYIDDCAYGELAYFSSAAKDPIKYLGIIQQENALFIIHESSDAVFNQFFESLPAIAMQAGKEMGASFLLFVLIRHILKEKGKLIHSYREEVEEIDQDFDHKYSAVDPAEFRSFKQHLSNFNRVLEKQYFSLSFPPTKVAIDKESPYSQYFEKLLQNLKILKESVATTEVRLNSLHDHYNLLLQEKSNKRLNFLTIIQAIFVPLTLVSGIYGMNFVNMPELNWHYGYFFLLGVLVLISSVFMRYFYKNGWFD